MRLAVLIDEADCWLCYHTNDWISSTSTVVRDSLKIKLCLWIYTMYTLLRSQSSSGSVGKSISSTFRKPRIGFWLWLHYVCGQILFRQRMLFGTTCNVYPNFFYFCCNQLAAVTSIYTCSCFLHFCFDDVQSKYRQKDFLFQVSNKASFECPRAGLSHGLSHRRWEPSWV